MTKHPKPHQQRSLFVLILIASPLVAIAVIMLFGCSPRNGCYATSGKNFKVGYHLKK